MLEETTEGIQSILGKVIVGMGKQDKIAKVGIIVYYLVVLPGAYLLAVKLHWGLFGIWGSISLGMVIISIWYTVIILKTNWEDLIEETIGFLALMSAKIEDEDIDDISMEFDTRALDLDK
jgi:Na+-driven multidrug efflux pump